MSIHARVSKEIMEGREAMRLTQTKAAKKCGISARQYLDLENGRSLPSLPTALHLSVAFGISWDALAQELFGEANLTYTVFEQQLVSENGEAYCGYGLACTVNGSVLSQIPDISCDKAFVAFLARSFTMYQLAPVHFLWAVQDIVARSSAVVIAGILQPQNETLHAAI